MKTKNLIFSTFVALTFILSASLSIFAQEPKKEDSTMKNAEVVELVKSGLSESIIIAKIKGSKTEFDTSSAALVKLKESGISDNLVLVMIEAKPKVEESKEPVKPETQKTADMKQPVGKRKMFLISADEESRLEIVKKLTSKGFIFMDNRVSAELIVELTFSEVETQQKVGVLRTGSETLYKSKIGKLVVRIKQDPFDMLVYAYEYPLASNANTASFLGLSVAPLSLQNQVKRYLVDDFLKKMKKAGDKIK
jgi:hypothetical protein